MCLRPMMIDGNEVPCSKCQVCVNNRINDYVGRCLCEAQVRPFVYAVTLTYRDGVGAVVLQYADFQKLIKKLRFAGLKVSYIVAGEYGALKGRAHWHAVIFSETAIELPLDRNVEWEPWSHGFTFARRAEREVLPLFVEICCKKLLQRAPVGDDVEKAAIRFSLRGGASAQACAGEVGPVWGDGDGEGVQKAVLAAGRLAGRVRRSLRASVG